jgi:hypothetical protein
MPDRAPETERQFLAYPPDPANQQHLKKVGSTIFLSRKNSTGLPIAWLNFHGFIVKEIKIAVILIVLMLY